MLVARLTFRLAAHLQRLPSRWLVFPSFVFFGAVNCILTYGIYLLLASGIAYPVAYTFSYASGIFISYYLNSRFVFREKLRLSTALQYPLVYLVQYLLGLGLLYLFVEIAHLSKFVAPILIVLFTVPATYFLSRRVIKRDAEPTPRP